MKIGKVSNRIAVVLLVAGSTVSSIGFAATSPVGRSIKFYETSLTRIARFVPAGLSCTPTAQESCTTLDQYGSGGFTDIEIASVTVSGSFGRSTLCANQNSQASYVLTHRGPGEDFALFAYDYRYELQSAVLNDLSLINPRTGLPFNGKIAFPVQTGFVDQDVVSDSHRLVRVHKDGSFECGFPLFTYSQLANQFGLSSFDAQRVMGGSVTIKMFITGRFINTEGGSFSMQLRMIGD